MSDSEQAEEGALGRTRTAGGRRQPLALVVFELAVCMPVIALIVVLLVRRDGLHLELIYWGALIALVDMLPVVAWRDVQMLMDFPLIIALALQFEPAAAALTVLLASLDPREFSRGVTPLRALFNRCQIAASALAAGAVFHALGAADAFQRPPAPVDGKVVVWATLAAVVAGYLVNVSIVSVGAGLLYREPLRRTVRRLRIGDPATFLVNYLGLGVVGVVVALLSRNNDLWTVLAFLVPVVLVRQLFYRSVALEQARKQLAVAYEAEAERMKAMQELSKEKADISAILTHDFLYAVASVRSSAVALKSRWPELGDVMRKELVRRIERESKRARDMAEEVVALMYLETEEIPSSPVPERVGDVVSEALDAVDELGGRLRINLEPGVDQVLIMADRSRILQVLRNLLINAMKYSPQGSGIGLWAEARTGEVVFGVDDEGPGIAAADQDKLFQRFSRLPVNSQSVPGSGLGLYISRRIIESHHGRIWVESEPGSGSSFRFSIPMVNRDLDAGEEDVISEGDLSEPEVAGPQPGPRPAARA